jgi:putative hydrolase of the HAD superfamily
MSIRSIEAESLSSIVAEFAREFHHTERRAPPPALTPLAYSQECEKLFDIRAVIFDVYGTLVRYWKPGFSDSKLKERALLAAFETTAAYFGMTPHLQAMDAETAPEKTLRDLYHGLITLSHEKSLRKGLAYPEIRIEEVWRVIVMMLKRHGYDPAARQTSGDLDFAKCVAYHYNATALGRGLYPGVADALVRLRERNILLGIVSNAQFYTPIDLTLFLRDQNDGIDDYREIFQEDLTVFSYVEGVSKPNPALFRRLYDALYEYHVLPEQTVFAGNDLSVDIRPARAAGMRTALFAGDDKSAFFHDLSGVVVPDITFYDWNELPERISLYADKGGSEGAA